MKLEEIKSASSKGSGSRIIIVTTVQALEI